MTTDTGNVTSRRSYFTDRLADRQYRDRFVHANIAQGIAAQIRAMREANGWTQATLGNVVGMKQSAVSQLENPDYGRASLTTLKRLAAAFDVGLAVRFEPFSELVNRSVSFTPASFAVPSFVDDAGLQNHDDEFAEVTTTSDLHAPFSQTEFPRAFFLEADDLLVFSHYQESVTSENEPMLIGVAATAMEAMNG